MGQNLLIEQFDYRNDKDQKKMYKTHPLNSSIRKEKANKNN